MAGLLARPRIALLPDWQNETRVDACAALRLIFPFTHPIIRKRFDVEIAGFDIRPCDYDLIVVQRMLNSELSFEDAVSFIGSLKRFGTKLIADLDDNLLDAHPDPASEAWLTRQRSKTRLLLRMADQVIVSTPLLAQRVAHLNPCILVSPNALPEEWIGTSIPSRTNDQVVIGCYGTLTHLRDFMTIAAGIRTALSRLGTTVRFELCGISVDQRIVEIFGSAGRVTVLPPIPNYPDFFRFMRDKARWDIGLAPLERGRFQDAKSDIKYLEFSAFGCAGIYSNAPAYDAVRDGETGLVRDNLPSEWAEAIVRLVKDRELRAALVERARETVRCERTIATAAERLSGILTQTLDEPALV